MQIGFIESTEKVSVTDSANTFTAPGPSEARRRVYICADIPLHIARNADADTNAMMVPANTPVLVSAFGNDTLSFVKADGADDGSASVSLTG